MQRWLDSRPPSDAQLAAARGADYGGWALYHGTPGDGIAPDHLASDEDFRRVLRAGLKTLAFVSGNQDPAAIAAWSRAMGILTVVDVERFIRMDGAWLDGWLATAGSGLYGNGAVHFEAGRPVGRGAACNIFAGYYGYDPRATWPSWLPRPHLCGWQIQGTHTEFGISVDSSWMDDAIAIGGDQMDHNDILRLAVMEFRQLYFFTGDKTLVPNDLALSDNTHVDITGPVFNYVPATLPQLKAELDEIKAQVAALPGGTVPAVDLTGVLAKLDRILAKVDKDLA